MIVDLEVQGADQVLREGQVRTTLFVDRALNLERVVVAVDESPDDQPEPENPGGELEQAPAS